MSRNLPAQLRASHVHEYDGKSAGVKSTCPKQCNSFCRQRSPASHEIVALSDMLICAVVFETSLTAEGQGWTIDIDLTREHKT